MSWAWRRRVSAFLVVLAIDGCRDRPPNTIQLFNRSGEELTYVAEERDHDAIGGAPPEVAVRSGNSRAWVVQVSSCLEGTVEARDADGNVVASWDQPCGRDQLRVDPPGEPIGAGSA